MATASAKIGTKIDENKENSNEKILNMRKPRKSSIRRGRNTHVFKNEQVNEYLNKQQKKLEKQRDEPLKYGPNGEEILDLSANNTMPDSFRQAFGDITNTEEQSTMNETGKAKLAEIARQQARRRHDDYNSKLTFNDYLPKDAQKAAEDVSQIDPNASSDSTKPSESYIQRQRERRRPKDWDSDIGFEDYVKQALENAAANKIEQARRRNTQGLVGDYSGVLNMVNSQQGGDVDIDDAVIDASILSSESTGKNSRSKLGLISTKEKKKISDLESVPSSPGIENISFNANNIVTSTPLTTTAPILPRRALSRLEPIHSMAAAENEEENDALVRRSILVNNEDNGLTDDDNDTEVEDSAAEDETEDEDQDETITPVADTASSHRSRTLSRDEPALPTPTATAAINRSASFDPNESAQATPTADEPILRRSRRVPKAKSVCRMCDLNPRHFY